MLRVQRRLGGGQDFWALIRGLGVRVLPNTAGCFTGEDAVRTLRLAREAGGWSLVKLEVLSNTAHLYPDMIETLRALDLLIKDGFDVMVYCTDDPVYARKLEDAGAERLPDGAAVTLAADHMPGMQGAEGTVHSSTDETVYMVDYESDGMRMRNHKWVVESEIASAG